MSGFLDMIMKQPPVQPKPAVAQPPHQVTAPAAADT